MKRYHYHPDNIIYIKNDNKIYFESVKFAKFDTGGKVVYPQEGSDEFEYISGYGTRNYNRDGMVSFIAGPRPELDELIEAIDTLIQVKTNRGNVTDDPWNIPEDMR